MDLERQVNDAYRKYLLSTIRSDVFAPVYYKYYIADLYTKNDIKLKRSTEDITTDNIQCIRRCKHNYNCICKGNYTCPDCHRPRISYKGRCFNWWLGVKRY